MAKAAEPHTRAHSGAVFLRSFAASFDEATEKDFKVAEPHTHAIAQAVLSRIRVFSATSGADCWLAYVGTKTWDDGITFSLKGRTRTGRRKS